MKVVTIVLLSIAINLYSDPLSKPCRENLKIISNDLRKNINSGIPVVLIKTISYNQQQHLISSIEIKYEPWDDEYVFKIRSKDKNTTQVVKKEQLDSHLCQELELQKTDWNSVEMNRIVYRIILNPITDDLAKQIESWAKKNAGAYNNLGMKIHWGNDDKSGKVIFKKDLSE